MSKSPVLSKFLPQTSQCIDKAFEFCEDLESGDFSLQRCKERFELKQYEVIMNFKDFKTHLDLIHMMVCDSLIHAYCIEGENLCSLPPEREVLFSRFLFKRELEFRFAYLYKSINYPTRIASRAPSQSYYTTTSHNFKTRPITITVCNNVPIYDVFELDSENNNTYYWICRPSNRKHIRLALNGTDTSLLPLLEPPTPGKNYASDVNEVKPLPTAIERLVIFLGGYGVRETDQQTSRIINICKYALMTRETPITIVFKVDGPSGTEVNVDLWVAQFEGFEHTEAMPETAFAQPIRETGTISAPTDSNAPVTKISVNKAVARPLTADLEKIRKTLATIGKGVKVQKSLIPNAGNGLFATQKFTAGENITEYSGYLMDYDTYKNSTTDKSHFRTLISMNYVIDGNRTENNRAILNPNARTTFGGAAFANSLDLSGAENKDYNSVYAEINDKAFAVTNPRTRLLVLRATKDIEENEEIYVNYGVGYLETSKK